MISALSVSNTSEKTFYELVGLSTDTKPTDGVANGSTFLEMNTGKIFMFNEEGNAWVEVQS